MINFNLNLIFIISAFLENSGYCCVYERPCITLLIINYLNMIL